MRFIAVLASAGFAVSVAGCAAPPPAPPAPMAATVPTPALASSGSVDGTYRAPAEKASGNTACGTTRFGYPVRVVNGIATMQTVSSGELQGPVGPDGSLRIESGRALLTGQFSGNTFSGTYTRNSCSFTLNYKK